MWTYRTPATEGTTSESAVVCVCVCVYTWCVCVCACLSVVLTVSRSQALMEPMLWIRLELAASADLLELGPVALTNTYIYDH